MKILSILPVLFFLVGLNLQKQTAAKPLTIYNSPNPIYDRGFHSGYVDKSSTETGVTVAVAGGKSKLGSGSSEQVEAQILYGTKGFVDGTVLPGMPPVPNMTMEAGLHQFHINYGNYGGLPVSQKLKVLSAGMEGGGNGVMVRASLAEGEMNLGPTSFKGGFGADTGVIMNDGVEAKVLGFGGKIGKNGIEVCVYFCVGLNWNKWFW